MFMMPSEREKANELFAINKKTVCTDLQAAGVDSVFVTYAGHGDSGGIDGVTYYDEQEHQVVEQNIKSKRVQFLELHCAWQEGERKVSVETREKNLHEAVVDLCYAAIEVAGFDGYENDDGGEGQITIKVKSQEININHRKYITDVLCDDVTV